MLSQAGRVAGDPMAIVNWRTMGDRASGSGGPRGSWGLVYQASRAKVRASDFMQRAPKPV